MRERKHREEYSNAPPSCFRPFFFFFLRITVWGLPLRLPLDAGAPHPGFSSSPFIFLWLFTAATEKREGLL